MSVKWRSVALAALMTIPGAVAASPAGAETKGGTDPTGDVPYCQGDVTQWSASNEPSALGFSVTAACASNPNTDPGWTVGDAVAVWAIDVDSNGSADFAAGFGNSGDGLIAIMTNSSGAVVCTGTPSWDGSKTFSASFSPDCIPGGGAFSSGAALVWDESPSSPSCTCPTDGAPNAGQPLVGPIVKGARHQQGYWMIGTDNHVYSFGDAATYPPTSGRTPTSGVVDIEPTPTGKGYWVLNATGNVFFYGDATQFSIRPPAIDRGEVFTAITATKSGKGVWLFTDRGRVITYGDAPHLGDMSATKLNGPVLDSIVTPSGNGYYMVASDGGIFTFGDAAFYGSMGATPLNKPVQSLVPDTDGTGYWLVASDGGIFAFEAPFYGSMGDTVLNKPVTGMVGFGNGYLMVGEDGGIFTFGDAPFFGSLGDNPPSVPITSVAVLNT